MGRTLPEQRHPRSFSSKRTSAEWKERATDREKADWVLHGVERDDVDELVLCNELHLERGQARHV